MPVNTPNIEYLDNLPRITRCRDVVEGTDAVKAATERYLPRLESMSKAGYNAYLKRALFDNMTVRLLQGFSGIITRRPPEIEAPEGMMPYFDDTTLLGTSFPELFKFVTDEILTTGRVPLLVDKGASGGRAYIVKYRAEQHINWLQNGNDPVVLSVFEEMDTSHDANDPYVLHYTTQYRSLGIDEEGYRVDIFQEPLYTTSRWGLTIDNKPYRVGSDQIPTLVESYRPTVQGQPMDMIPLTVITPMGVQMEPVKPPIADIVDINLSHYRSSADLEQGRHWVSLPTPIVSGVDGDTVLRVGSETAWILPDKDARAYYLEFQGQGLKSLETALAEKQQQMVQFSSRLMDTSTRGSEAADAVKLRNMSDSATLTSMTHAIEAGFNRVYKTIAIWEGFNPDDVNVTLNKDFVNTTLSAAEIKALVDAYLNKSIDEETLVFNLKRGDLLPAGKQGLDNKPDEEDENDT